jgi:hypothetical protein
MIELGSVIGGGIGDEARGKSAELFRRFFFSKREIFFFQGLARRLVATTTTTKSKEREHLFQKTKI